jgi:ubiquinone/menaquinone biosynthesis C-methylase UbiE
MLDAAREYVTGQGVRNVTFEPADAENLPFEGEVFDLVTCRIAPHHFPDCARFVCEGARVLKPGGMLLVQDHVLPENEQAARYLDRFEKLRDPSHIRTYRQSEWIGMFRDAGLEVEHLERVSKTHRFIAWAERQGCTFEVIERLTVLLEDPPPPAAAWMQARHIGRPEASFMNYHIIIAGRKRAFR